MLPYNNETQNIPVLWKTVLSNSHLVLLCWPAFQFYASTVRYYEIIGGNDQTITAVTTLELFFTQKGILDAILYLIRYVKDMYIRLEDWAVVCWWASIYNSVMCFTLKKITEITSVVKPNYTPDRGFHPLWPRHHFDSLCSNNVLAGLHLGSQQFFNNSTLLIRIIDNTINILFIWSICLISIQSSNLFKTIFANIFALNKIYYIIKSRQFFNNDHNHFEMNFNQK